MDDDFLRDLERSLMFTEANGPVVSDLRAAIPKWVGAATQAGMTTGEALHMVAAVLEGVIQALREVDETPRD